VGFSKALDLVRTVIKKYDAIHAEAVKEVRVTKVAAFNLINEVLARTERLLQFLSELENAVEKGKVVRFCSGWILTREDGRISASRFKPALAVSYDERSGRVTLTDSVTTVSIGSSSIKIRFRNFSKEIRLSRDAIEADAEIIKALGSKILFVVDALLARIETCAKSFGIRI